MSLSPVTGTDVPETANGVVTPVSSENGPHVPGSVKHLGSRVPGSGDPSKDTENNVDVESRVYYGKGHLEKYNKERMSSLLLHTSHEMDASLPTATSIGDSSSRDTVIPEDSNIGEPPGAAPSRASACSKDSRQQGGQAPTHRWQREAETVYRGTDSQEEEDGENEKQDEEEDEKSENKWIYHRTEVEVGGLFFPALLNHA